MLSSARCSKPCASYYIVESLAGLGRNSSCSERGKRLTLRQPPAPQLEPYLISIKGWNRSSSLYLSVTTSAPLLSVRFTSQVALF